MNTWYEFTFIQTAESQSGFFLLQNHKKREIVQKAAALAFNYMGLQFIPQYVSKDDIYILTSPMILIIKAAFAYMAVKHHLFFSISSESFRLFPNCFYTPPESFIYTQNMQIEVLPCPFTTQVPGESE